MLQKRATRVADALASLGYTLPLRRQKSDDDCWFELHGVTGIATYSVLPETPVASKGRWHLLSETEFHPSFDPFTLVPRMF